MAGMRLRCLACGWEARRPGEREHPLPVQTALEPGFLRQMLPWIAAPWVAAALVAWALGALH